MNIYFRYCSYFKILKPSTIWRLQCCNLRRVLDAQCWTSINSLYTSFGNIDEIDSTVVVGENLWLGLLYNLSVDLHSRRSVVMINGPISNLTFDTKNRSRFIICACGAEQADFPFRLHLILYNWRRKQIEFAASISWQSCVEERSSLNRPINTLCQNAATFRISIVASWEHMGRNIIPTELFYELWTSGIVYLVHEKIGVALNTLINLLIIRRKLHRINIFHLLIDQRVIFYELDWHTILFFVETVIDTICIQITDPFGYYQWLIQKVHLFVGYLIRCHTRFRRNRAL